VPEGSGPRPARANPCGTGILPVNRAPTYRYAIDGPPGQSSYHDMWMPPQEGVKLSESPVEAVHRCLEVECGIDLPSDSRELARYMHIRSCRFMGVVELPPDRHGERPVADDAVGTVLETVTLKRKAYWMATILLRDRSDIAPVADGRELVDVQWFTFDEAADVIWRTNHAEKANLLIASLEACRRDLMGGPRPQERATPVDDG
jgi:hypothetical protein